MNDNEKRRPCRFPLRWQNPSQRRRHRPKCFMAADNSGLSINGRVTTIPPTSRGLRNLLRGSAQFVFRRSRSGQPSHLPLNHKLPARSLHRQLRRKNRCQHRQESGQPKRDLPLRTTARWQNPRRLPIQSKLRCRLNLPCEYHSRRRSLPSVSARLHSLNRDRPHRDPRCPRLTARQLR